MSLYSIKLFVGSLLFTAIFTTATVANTVLPERVETAINALEATKTSVPRFYYERQTFKKGVKTELKAFDPKRPIAERWQVIFPSRKENHSEHQKLQKKYAKWDGNSDIALIIPDMRKRMQNGAKLIETKDNMEIYQFKITDDYFLEGGGRKSEISQHILGEMAIDVTTNNIRRIRYYAPNPFKPLSIVKLNQYEIVQHIAPAWDGGPLVRVYETSKVEGSAPFTKIRVDEIMINENFKPVN